MSTNPKPRTPAQIEASRRNGAKSKGPKSAEGRAKAALNSLKHGFTSRVAIALNHEDKQLFNEFLDAYVRTYMPANHAEHQLVTEIAKCNWRLDRLNNIEASLLDIRTEERRQEVRERYGSVSDNDRIALAFLSLACRDTREMHLLSRYEATARRGLINVTAALARMQAARKRQVPANTELQNEPGKRAQVIPICIPNSNLPDAAASRVPFGLPAPGPEND